MIFDFEVLRVDCMQILCELIIEYTLVLLVSDSGLCLGWFGGTGLLPSEYHKIIKIYYWDS